MAEVNISREDWARAAANPWFDDPPLARRVDPHKWAMFRPILERVIYFMLEWVCPKKYPPDIGFLKVRYGRSRAHRGACRTCRPEWRGPMRGSNQLGAFEAFQDALNHAIVEHDWSPLTAADAVPRSVTAPEQGDSE